jgi:uncharacterized protein
MKSNSKLILFFVLSCLVGAINGIFGGGGGILCIPIFKKLLKLPEKQAHATAVLVMSIISLPTLAIYLATLHFQFSQLIFVTLGSLVGGLIGVCLLGKLSDKSLNILYILVLILSAIKSFV